MFLLVSRSLPALAHAELIRSSPVADERLTRFPEQVVLWFDEELDTRESWFRLFDTEGQLVHAPEGRVDLNDLDHASLIA